MPTTHTPFRCWGCRVPLADHDGISLYPSQHARIRRPVTLWCPCGGATFWRANGTIQRISCWGGCGAILGTSDGATLMIGATVEVRRDVTLWCVCGSASHWRVRTVATVCYTEQVEVAL